jgi:F plasmid transfer operon, TraF, protein
MAQKITTAVFAVLLAFAFSPAYLAAQPLDQLGNRAAGLSAFVAVADDASAVAWNPAGLVNGPIFNILVDLGHGGAEPPSILIATGPAGQTGTLLLAVGFPPLGISYSRSRQTELSPAVGDPPSREDRQVSVRSLVTSHLGISVLQSLTDNLAVGATAKLVRGEFAAARDIAIRSWDEGFDAAESLEGHGRTTGDVDVGALASAGRMRFGIVARNLAAPTFDDGRENGEAVTVERHVRVGVAWADSWPGNPSLIVAVDADVTRVDYPQGERRDVAGGVERWFRGRTVAIRGGLRASTAADARPIASAGASLALRAGTYVEVYGASGDRDRRWGIAGRLTY